MNLAAMIVVTVVGVMAGVGVLGGGALIYFQDRQAQLYFQEFASTTATAVTFSLEQSMLAGKTADMQRQVVRVGESPGISSLAILNSEGRVAASAAQVEVGKLLDMPQVRQVLVTSKPFTKWETINGRREFSMVAPIVNKPACQSCHDPRQQILGAIKVGIDAAPLAAQLRGQALLMGGSALAGFFTVVLALTLLFRRMITNRLAQLKDIAARVAQGDYSVRSQEKGRDEIAVLAHSLDAMTERVQHRDQQIRATAELNLKAFNERVQFLEEATQRGKRLSQLSRMIALAFQRQAPLEMAKEFLQLIQEEVPAEYASLTLVNPNGTLGERAESFGGIVPFALAARSGGMAEQVLRTGQSQYVSDTWTDPQANPALVQAGLRSYVGLPIKADGRLAGILFLHSTQPDAFQKEREFLESIAGVLALILHWSTAAQEQT